MLKNDDDIIRGLGFVTLYAAYLEEQIDELLDMLNPLENYDEKKKKWAIRRKIRYSKRIIANCFNKEFEELIEVLNDCLKLFKRRNEMVHGRIYGNYNRPDTLKSDRNKPEREIHAKELYDLANELESFRSEVYRPMVIKLPRAIEKYLFRKDNNKI